MSKRPNKRADQDQRDDDDQSLWRRVAETVTPIDRSCVDQDRVRVGGSEKPPCDTPATPLAQQSKQDSTKIAVKKKAVPISDPQRVAPPEPTGLGQSQTRRLRAGRTRIEARLDLHGMRQSEAHGALKRFLVSSQQKGLRWVLVITGKGGRQTGTDDAVPFDGSSQRVEPGVLRRNVPRWLHEPDLRPLIIGFQEAAPQHGGEGALYINLRRHDRVKKY